MTIDAVELAAMHYAVDASLSTLACVMGIDFGPLDFDSVHVSIGWFMVAVISDAPDEATYFGGTS